VLTVKQTPSRKIDYSGSLKAYEDQGFAIVRGLISTEAAGRIREVIDGLYERLESLPPGHVYNLDPDPARVGPGGIPAVRGILSLAPWLADEIEEASLAASRRYLGEAGAILWDAAVYMPPGHPEIESAWHQDICIYQLTGKRPPRSGGYFWVALDDVDPWGGAIRFVPGSHKGPLLPHGWRRGDESSGLEVLTPIDPASTYTATLKAGDATFHHPRMLHGAGPNVSDRCRKAWVIGVGAPRLPLWLHHARKWISRR
jgi:hypothetical protein